MCVCTQTPDFIPSDLLPPNSRDLNPVDYSVWSIMQEKVYQTHIVNINEMKHWWVGCGQDWTTDILLQLTDSGDNTISMHV